MKWIAPSLRIKDLDLDIQNQICSAKVADLQSDDGCWNWKMLESWLPEAILNKIVGIHPPCIDAGSNLQVGFGDDIDGFSIGRSYNYLMQYDRDHVGVLWKKVWKL